MTTRRPLGTGPAPAVDNQGAPPGKAVPRAVLAAERLDGATAAQPVSRPAGRRPLSTGPTSAE
ncbi:hypothetical protein R2B67_35900 [Streptomyces cyaneofuscatus]|uniref:hypothetical protein n=1 Tax=Streptomyces cyaneofuscatus TaxID=66883 RepID=UPI002954FB02|nr:hypothetical protein [Streptomyces cyaneofuscatus]WOP07020.1 hypothetical protein R2B67_00030 [Streptomyces cyaneofuscatus]WOP13598.1 hypothetical protein R2B67_35900 [Streptomyces cyaneofuscatus]